MQGTPPPLSSGAEQTDDCAGSGRSPYTSSGHYSDRLISRRVLGIVNVVAFAVALVGSALSLRGWHAHRRAMDGIDQQWNRNHVELSEIHRHPLGPATGPADFRQIGRASCRERV